MQGYNDGGTFYHRPPPFVPAVSYAEMPPPYYVGYPGTVRQRYPYNPYEPRPVVPVSHAMFNAVGPPLVASPCPPEFVPRQVAPPSMIHHKTLSNQNGLSSYAPGVVGQACRQGLKKTVANAVSHGEDGTISSASREEKEADSGELFRTIAKGYGMTVDEDTGIGKDEGRSQVVTRSGQGETDVIGLRPPFNSGTGHSLKLNPTANEYRPGTTLDHAGEENESETGSGSMTYKLPQRPAMLSGLSLTLKKSSEHAATQTEIEGVKFDESFCSECKKKLNSGAFSKLPIFTKVKEISTEHKCKYVACQASVLLRESSRLLDTPTEFRAKLKKKLQALCRQFYATTTSMTEWEEEAICDIAVTLLTDSPDLALSEHSASFLRQLIQEVNSHLEIAQDLMNEKTSNSCNSSPRLAAGGGKMKSGIERISTSSVISLPATGSTTSVASNLPVPPGHPPLLPGQPPMLNPQLLASSMSVSGASNIGPAGDSVLLELQKQQQAAELLRLQHLYLQNLLSLNMAKDDVNKINNNNNNKNNNKDSDDKPISDHTSRVPMTSNVDASMKTLVEDMEALDTNLPNSKNPSPEVVNLTTGNLKIHNALIMNKRAANGTDTNSSASEVPPPGISSHLHSSLKDDQKPAPLKPLSKLGKKIPPLDLRPSTLLQKGLPPPLKLGKKVVSVPNKAESVCSDESLSTGSGFLDIKHSMTSYPPVTNSNPVFTSASSLSATSKTSLAFQPSHFKTPLTYLSNPDPTLVSATLNPPKPRKFLTPLQRKRLKNEQAAAAAAALEAEKTSPPAELHTENNLFMKSGNVGGIAPSLCTVSSNSAETYPSYNKPVQRQWSLQDSVSISHKPSPFSTTTCMSNSSSFNTAPSMNTRSSFSTSTPTNNPVPPMTFSATLTKSHMPRLDVSDHYTKNPHSFMKPSGDNISESSVPHWDSKFTHSDTSYTHKKHSSLSTSSSSHELDKMESSIYERFPETLRSNSERFKSLIINSYAAKSAALKDDTVVTSTETAQDVSNIMSEECSGDYAAVVAKQDQTAGSDFTDSDTSSASKVGGYGLDDIRLTDNGVKKDQQNRTAHHDIAEKWLALDAKNLENGEKKNVKPSLEEEKDDEWKTVTKPKKVTKKEDIKLEKFRTQEKYSNLTKVIRSKHPKLARPEAQEVLETVFTATNGMPGMRQPQILEEVRNAVQEIYPEKLGPESEDDLDAVGSDEDDMLEDCYQRYPDDDLTQDRDQEQQTGSVWDKLEDANNSRTDSTEGQPIDRDCKVQ